jgi:hypothetical protein
MSTATLKYEVEIITGTKKARYVMVVTQGNRWIGEVGSFDLDVTRDLAADLITDDARGRLNVPSN